MAKQELLVEVKKLISIGKEKGFLTYDELNSTLPAEVVSSEQFGSIMTMFGEMDIEIVDAPEGERHQKNRNAAPDQEEAGQDDDYLIPTILLPVCFHSVTFERVSLERVSPGNFGGGGLYPELYSCLFSLLLVEAILKSFIPIDMSERMEALSTSKAAP